jgi:uncharacterized protein (TIGR03790 family)
MRNRAGVAMALLLASGVVVRLCQASITPAQVLVVYNSQATDATTIKDAYLAVHPAIPAANVFDLNDASIAGVPDVSYTDFINKIRSPIRNYLTGTGGHPAAADIISICLIRGIPHRIQDTDNATVGDAAGSVGAEFNAGDYTAASVDSELTLLWQDLNALPAAEAGGTMDSHADNIIDNPYHMSSSSIASFPRSDTSIKVQKNLTNLGNVAWTYLSVATKKLTAGDIYLVCRLDGNTAADVIAAINRAQNIYVNRRYAWVVLDEDVPIPNPNPPPTWLHPELDNLDLFTTPNPTYFYAGNDYEDTRDLLQPLGWKVDFDDTTTFITPALLPRPIIAYSSYGENHVPQPANPSSYVHGFQFARGAIFNTYESYNGRGFNGLGTLFQQEQVADFISVGGTFGIGHVWEPLAFTIPDNEYLFVNFLQNGLTWAEAAWSSIPVLSWMHVVIGDPLAHVTAVVDQPADFDADGDIDQDDVGYMTGCIQGSNVTPPTFGCADADLDGDSDVDQSDFGLFQRCLGEPGVLANPTCAN